MITRGDYVVEEGTRHEGEEGQVLGIDGDEAFVNFGMGRTRGVLLSHLADSPWTENEDWDSESESESDEPSSVEIDGTEIRVNTDTYEKFDGAEGEVLYTYEHGGEEWAMVFLYMPHDRKKDFPVTDLEEI